MKQVCVHVAISITFYTLYWLSVSSPSVYQLDWLQGLYITLIYISLIFGGGMTADKSQKFLEIWF